MISVAEQGRNLVQSAKPVARSAASALTRLEPLRRRLRAAALSGRLPRPIWQRLPSNESSFRVEFEDGTGFSYAVDEADPFIRQLYWRGLDSAEGASLAAFHDAARAARTVLDVGAHTGLYSLAALTASGHVRVVAFEPVLANVTALAANLEANSWTHRCEVRRQAVADQVGTVNMHVPFGDHPMSSSLDPRGFRGLPGHVEAMAATSLDAAVPSDLAVDLVKIDVEGFEDVVLDGMGELLARCRPTVMIECNPDGPVAAIERRLRAHGYRFRHLNGIDTEFKSSIVPDASETYRNFLCVAGG